MRSPRLRAEVMSVAAVLLVGVAGAWAWARLAPEMHAAAVTKALRVEVSAARHPATAPLYAARDGKPLWLAPADRAAALALLAAAGFDGLVPDSFGVDALRTTAAVAASDSGTAALDVALTDAVLAYGDALVAPRADAAALYGVNWTPAVRRLGPAARLAAALAAPEATPARVLPAWADGLRPPHDGYRWLRAVLVRETRLAARPDLALETDLAPGDSGQAVVRLRARLAVEAEALGGRPPEAHGAVLDAALSGALAAWQRRAGLAATGTLDAASRHLLNRRQPDVLPLVRLNLERWRWLPDTLGALHVWVNLPSFEAVVREAAPDGWHEVLRTRVVIGQRTWKTPVFSDTMETVVFNPTWTIPPSIQREQYGRVERRAVVRPPGPGNALGRVKFLFPNRHAVYLHDTPSKWAFGVDDRARSHGCVRVGDPRDLATALLARTNGWTPDAVAAIFAGPWRLRDVALERPVLVHLVYFTATADAAGRVTVWRDVYGHDAWLADALGLSLDGVPPPTPRAPPAADSTAAPLPAVAAGEFAVSPQRGAAGGP